MIDFPSSPTVGQQFAAAGVIWTWDGTKWTAQGLSPTFLPLSGGVLSGPLGAPVVSIQNAAGNANPIWGDINGNARWLLELGDGVAETGANAGSNFAIASYSDAGAFLAADLTINRATGIVAAPSGLSAPQARNDNRIINGNMLLNQRGVANGTATGYLMDRWLFGATQPTKFTWSQDPANQPGIAGPGFPVCLSFQSFGVYAPLATDAFQLQQPIEAALVSDFVWGTPNARPVTLSFWALANNVSGTFGGAIFNYPLPATRSYPFTFSVPVAGVWTKIAITIPGDTGGTWVMTGSAAAFAIAFDLGAGANFRAAAGAWLNGNLRGVNGTVQLVNTNGGYLALTGIKLETGIVATDFNRQTLSKTISDCERYYQILDKILGGPYADLAGRTLYLSSIFRTVMRGAPTATLGSQSNANITAGSVAFLQTTSGGTGLTAVAIAAGATTININNSTLSAEL